ncbi:MAG: CpaE family protein [Ilumatobacteraceae bacterium]
MTADTPIIAVVTDDTRVETAAIDSPGATFCRVAWSDGSEPLTVEVIRDRVLEKGAVVACIAADVPIELALDLARTLDEGVPPAGSVLLRPPTPDLWRDAAKAGIRDIIGPGSSSDELRAALLAEATRIQRIRATRIEAGSPDDTRGRIIVILSPKGGSGKTMLSTNLSVALAMGSPTQTVLVDLDCEFGDVASVLGLVPEHTIGQLASLPTFDSTTLKVFLTRHEQSGLFVLAGSGLPEEGEAVTAEIAMSVLRSLADEGSLVVVDTAAGLDERALAAIDVATDLVFLASLDVTSIRNLGKEIDALDRLGATSQRRHFVINRADSRVGLEVSDVEAAIGMKIEAAMPSSRTVPLSMNQGTVVVMSDADSPVARSVVAFARQFLPDGDSTDAIERRNRFFKWRAS